MRESIGSLIAFGCTNPDCGSVVPAQVPFLYDEVLKRGYCLPCGQRLRYHRRKWLERGEAMPKDFAEINARFERR